LLRRRQTTQVDSTSVRCDSVGGLLLIDICRHSNLSVSAGGCVVVCPSLCVSARLCHTCTHRHK